MNLCCAYPPLPFYSALIPKKCKKMFVIKAHHNDFFFLLTVVHVSDVKKTNIPIRS
uniref:Uncharacterized protein n=1 Tax=Arundo donax TaxID=35708 RepID=A0A0A8ZBS6_ARUDO